MTRIIDEPRDVKRGLLIHEWIEPAGGAEKVLDEFVDMHPQADIFCLWNDDVERYPNRIVYESWLAKTALRRSKAVSLPLLPNVWSNAKFGDYEWALISSHLFAHHAASNKFLQDVPTFVYAHTPARYIWEPDLDERGDSAVVRAVAPAIRTIDRRRAASPTHIAANSEFVRKRIQDCWNRDAEVIYPPVDVTKITSVPRWSDLVTSEEAGILESLPEVFLLGASRLVAYKRLDDVIAVGDATKLPVVIAGSGPDHLRLQSIAEEKRVKVYFLGRVSDEMLFALYAKALAFIFPAIEDFGIMPVEAMASGTPVIAPRIGGAAESVIHGSTGSLIDFSSTEDIRLAVGTTDSISPEKCIQRASSFDRSVFRNVIDEWLELRVAAK